MLGGTKSEFNAAVGNFTLIIPLESTQMSHTVLINFQVDINFLHALLFQQLTSPDH